MLLFTTRAKVVGITRAPSTSHGTGRGVGAVVVDVGPDQHQALRHAERKAQTYGKALVGLASLLCLSVCGNLASSALTILVFKDSRTRGAVQPALSASKPAAPTVGTGLTPYGPGPTGMSVPPFEVPTLPQPKVDKPSDPKPAPVGATAPAADTGEVSTASVPGMKRCAIAPSGTEACWELADPTMTDISEDFLEGNTYLTGTLKVGAAVKTIGSNAFAYTKLTGLDLSGATSLATIGDSAFFGTDLHNTLVIPATVKAIGTSAFTYTKLAGLNLTEATALVSIGDGAFSGAGLTGTIVIPASVTAIGDDAFYNTELTGLDLSDSTTLSSIGSYAFSGTGLTGTIVTPSKVPRYAARDTFPPGVSIVSVSRLEHVEVDSGEDE